MGTGHEIAMSLRAAYLAMHRASNAPLAGEGVTADQFVALAVLAQEDGITQQALVRRTSSDPNTIRAMLVLLERRGLVARKRHPSDGRARSVVLTEKGRRTYAKLRTKSQAVRERLVGLFRPDEARMLIEFLGRISENMTDRKRHGREAGIAQAEQSGNQ
ncbi:MAG: MarR family winged helix-turn-helix transcriptional regulator [Bacillota bacterium]